jgi:hypothetical protein
MSRIDLNTKGLSPGLIEKLKPLIEKHDKLDDECSDLRDEINKLVIGEAAIKVDDVIVWNSSKYQVKRRGRVIRVTRHWDEFHFRVVVLTKTGKPIGNATVTESHHPELEQTE